MRVFIIFLFLMNCVAPPIVTRDEWTGQQLTITKAYEISRTSYGIAEMRPVIGTINGTFRYGILTNIRRLDANGPQIIRITSPSGPMDYHMHDRLRTHCIDGCKRSEIGAIHLSYATFAAAAKYGLALRIWGKRGRHEGKIPASAFQTALLNARFLQ